MPTFDFKCQSCGAIFEEMISLKNQIPACLNCGSKKVRKLISGFHIGGGASPKTSGCSRNTCSACPGCSFKP